ncbi:M48 family metallopeptidase [Swaminathania salitolerans]|uniref:Peptidase M48 domain-containing protein n=1 Tax=Swaminathania salitolerans TaxID=182838 RepID=A0A511BMY5_9PROT|nr:M48 family metallopeptidase [Swaminathania salitolerans]GBQ13955.1 Zn-dependent protease [Swaminathania salitolerans LMG 21291]GEL01681.1 hypothetical protein SSA02_08440 [Swaminathania salitolerans]
MSPIIKKLRHPKEGLYGGIIRVFGCLFWIFILLFAIAEALSSPHGGARILMILLYFVLGLVFTLFGEALFRARAIGNMVEVTPAQFPRIHGEITDVARALGLAVAPRTFIYNSHGVTNAFAMRLFRTRYVFLTSGIVEADDDAQLRFIIAHEIAHHVLGHLNTIQRFLAAPGIFVPFLYPAYSRAREFSCDAVGASVIPDPEKALTALQMLACGARRLNAQMNSTAFYAQEDHVPGIAGFVLEIFSSHPRLTRRVQRLRRCFPARRAPVS